jgi:hypothetical protein
MQADFNASSRILRHFVLIASFLRSIMDMLLRLEQLKLYTLQKRFRLEAWFLTQGYRGRKFYPSLLETVDLLFLDRYVRHFCV